MEITSIDSEQTQHIASQIAPHLHGGDIIALYGELGSGKTTFTQGLARALGIKQPVVSPTFITMQIYPVADHPSIKLFCHIDAYRLQSNADIISTGITDYLGRSDTLSVIEWPENITSLLPPATKQIKFSHLKTNRRLITITDPALSFLLTKVQK